MPTIAPVSAILGETVLYTLTDQDAAAVNAEKRNNRAHAGELYPAIVVRVWGEGLVNLRVLIDGPGELWATSKHDGTEPGQWQRRAG